MRILFRVTVGMMFPVHNGVSPWIQKRCAFENVSHQVEYPFPRFTHGKHSVGSITMLKKRLEEQG